MAFAPEELERYARHFLLPQWSGKAQKALKNAKILYIGAGGLGCPALTYLAGAGIGTIAIMDADTVSLGNLPRQTLYTTDDVGNAKVTAAAKRLQALNPHCNIHPIKAMFTAENSALIEEYDLIADGCDSFATRHLVNKACVTYQKPLFSAAVSGFKGQVYTFHGYAPQSPCYACLYPENATTPIEDCSSAGVISMAASITGLWQALEIIKHLTKIGTSFSGQMFMFDTLTGDNRSFTIMKNSHCSICAASQK